MPDRTGHLFNLFGTQLASFGLGMSMLAIGPASRLGQSKGYKEGNSLDTDAAEKCSLKVYLPGYKRQPGDCRNVNYVTRVGLAVTGSAAPKRNT